jgi:hypothetical protein
VVVAVGLADCFERVVTHAVPIAPRIPLAPVRFEGSAAAVVWCGASASEYLGGPQETRGPDLGEELSDRIPCHPITSQYT